MVLNYFILLGVLVFLIFSISKLKWHPFISLILSALSLGIFLGLGGKETVNALLEGFGNTMQWIAIIVILGAFIGEVLTETGGALRIAEKIVKIAGRKLLPWAMGFSGYLISIPVFVDVAYIVLQPVTEAISRRVNKPILMIGLALTAGLTVAHTLIPPTPGPMAVASILSVNIGKLLIVNGLVGLFAVSGGVLWASLYCKDKFISYDEKLKNQFSPVTAQVLKSNAKRGKVLLDLLPILIPIFLMSIGTIFNFKGFFGTFMDFLAIPMVAVMVGATLAWIQFRIYDKNGNTGRLVERAIVKSALVIMITGAGGAFGNVIKVANVHEAMVGYFVENASLGFILPFAVAALLTISTGSITVSLIGAASLMAPISISMPYSVEIMAALIGAGSFWVFHANASFFWLLNRLHEVPVNVLYRTYTIQSFFMGLFGLLGAILLYLSGIF